MDLDLEITVRSSPEDGPPTWELKDLGLDHLVSTNAGFWSATRMVVDFRRDQLAPALEALSFPGSSWEPCPHGDSTCPCPDGGPCHYEADAPMRCPRTGVVGCRECREA